METASTLMVAVQDGVTIFKELCKMVCKMVCEMLCKMVAVQDVVQDGVWCVKCCARW